MRFQRAITNLVFILFNSVLALNLMNPGSIGFQEVHFSKFEIGFGEILLMECNFMVAIFKDQLIKKKYE